MGSSLLTLVGPTITSLPPPPPSLRLKHMSISSNPALVGNNLLPAVVGLPKTLVYKCWGLGDERKNSSIILRRFRILVFVGSLMDRTDRISISR